jgi:hypothetical protein
MDIYNIHIFKYVYMFDCFNVAKSFLSLSFNSVFPIPFQNAEIEWKKVYRYTEANIMKRCEKLQTRFFRIHP